MCYYWKKRGSKKLDNADCLCLKIVIIIPNMFSFVEVANSAQLHLQILLHNTIWVALSFCASPSKFYL